jgi:hypothetical protein
VGLKLTIRYLAVVGSAFLVVTVPFYLYDPQNFTPLLAQQAKVSGIEDVLPFGRMIIPASALALSTVLALRRLGPDCDKLFQHAAVVQLFVLLFTSTVWSIKLNKLDLFVGQAGYGMFTLIFAIMAAGLIYARRDQVVNPVSNT